MRLIVWDFKLTYFKILCFIWIAKIFYMKFEWLVLIFVNKINIDWILSTSVTPICYWLKLEVERCHRNSVVFSTLRFTQGHIAHLFFDAQGQTDAWCWFVYIQMSSLVILGKRVKSDNCPRFSFSLGFFIFE